MRDDVATDGPFATDEMAYSLGADGTLAVALFGCPTSACRSLTTPADRRFPMSPDAARGPKAGLLRLTRWLDALLLDLD